MRLTTAGIDVGSSAIKVAIIDDEGDGAVSIRGLAIDRIRRRDPRVVLDGALRRALEEARVDRQELAYVATTGEGDLAAEIRTGHFYGMTAHARGGVHLDPRSRAILDVGALYARAVLMDERGKVLSYRMTSQCAAGTGQFVENIARYLGVRLDEVGALSIAAPRAEPVSGICAVLAETDVINMVSRGVPTAAILRGIHESIAHRLAKLLRSARASSPVMVTGGLAADTGLIAALRARLAEEGANPLEILTHPPAPTAGG
jgi:benzoyl-CoA reductase subunit D